MSRLASSLAALQRLTQGERACLARVLDHRTAKEIALDLGITHHAVEKRLRRARDKLGAHSSVEAARWYAEHYGVSVYGPSELAFAQENADISQSPHRTAAKQWRNAAMITSSLALSLMLVGSNALTTPEPTDLASILENTFEQELQIAAGNFARLDEDQSGFIERSEFVSEFTEYFANLAHPHEADGDAGAKMIAFEANEVHLRYIDTDGDKAIIQLKDHRIAERREVLFGLIDRNEDDRIDPSEFRLAHLEGIGPKTFTVQLDKHDG